MGLPLGVPAPDPHSRLAAEVARRVMGWADAQRGNGSGAETPPIRSGRLSRSLQSKAFLA